MKKLRSVILAALLGACALPAFASGPLDGIYQCTVSGAGQSYSLFMTVNGKTNSQSFFVIAAVGNNSPFKGFGYGTATSTAFAGTTDSGESFAMTVSGNDPARSMSGNVGVKVNNVPVTASASCLQVY
jgi:hypothetical protein